MCKVYSGKLRSIYQMHCEVVNKVRSIGEVLKTDRWWIISDSELNFKHTVTYFICFNLCINLCLWRCVLNLGFCAARGSNWFMLTSPSSGKTVSTQIRQMLSRHDVTSMFDTEPLKTKKKTHVIFLNYQYFFNISQWSPRANFQFDGVFRPFPSFWGVQGSGKSVME